MLKLYSVYLGPIPVYEIRLRNKKTQYFLGPEDAIFLSEMEKAEAIITHIGMKFSGDSQILVDGKICFISPPLMLSVINQFMKDKDDNYFRSIKKRAEELETGAKRQMEDPS